MEALLRAQDHETGFNPEVRLYDDTTTLMAEMLDGNMRTSFDYFFDGHELHGRDNGALKPIFKKSIIDAQRLVSINPNLAFELRRRWIEMGEYKDMIAMASGELPTNTMVTISDFPPELMDATKDVGGYNTKRKQTMLRVITKNPDGQITMYSQSLDRSDRTALEAIYGYFGEKPKPGELLGQRIYKDLHAEEQESLPERLTRVYDKSLESRYGGEWYGGRTPAEMLNTFDFVRRQDDLLSTFFAGSNNETTLFNLAAAMRKRFEARRNEKLTKVVHIDTQEALYIELQQAGLEARAEGRTFSGCGMSLAASELSTTKELNIAGFGNKVSSEVLKCVFCPLCKKEGVDAYVKDEEDKKTITCSSCKKSKVYHK